MNTKLLKPNKKAIIYEDEKLYACLATYPITKGHVVVAWKNDVQDLKKLPERDYDYLMDTVNTIRNAMLKVLKIKKVYLVYMDEAKHVHWHLIPRYNEKGYDIFLHKPKKLNDFNLTNKLKQKIKFE